MRCEEAREHIPDHIAGALASSLEGRLFEHLEECDRCRAEIQDVRQLWSDLEEIPPVKPRYEVMRAKFEEAMNDMSYQTQTNSLRLTTKPLAIVFAALSL